MSEYQLNNMTKNNIAIAASLKVIEKVMEMTKAYDSIIGILNCYGEQADDIIETLLAHNIYLVNVTKFVNGFIDKAYDINDLDIETLKEELQGPYLE